MDTEQPETEARSAPPSPNPPPGRAHLSLETTEPSAFGHGFISGLLSALLGIAGFGLVAALRFPQWFSFSELHPLYEAPVLRGVIHLILVAAFLLGSVSAVLRKNKALALTGIGFTLAAALLGGSRVPSGGGSAESVFLSLDFFVLSLLLYAAVFVPLERLFAVRPEQPVFRRHWTLDLTYFFFNSLLIEVLAILALVPALVFFAWARVGAVEAALSGVPVLLQVPLLLLVADFTQYWIHRAFHLVPLLWRFHAIHHSVEEMDWLAGSRLHLVDVIVTRGLVYLPVFLLGFSEQALYVYVFIVAAQATFIHANVRWEFRPIRRLIATPVFHHWHHSAEREARDRNFAVHTPIWDLLFGTFYLPDRWPREYGLGDGQRLPSRWAAQLLHPFRRKGSGEPR